MIQSGEPGLEPLPRRFYFPSAARIAKQLLGHWLVRKTNQGLVGGPIVETEAYLANDPACHAAPGLTNRNRVMFGPPGHAYVYFIYGCHWCVNAVCQPAGAAEAVLIRGLEPTFGLDLMTSTRSRRPLHELTNGPAKLCQALALDGSFNGADLCDPGSALIIAINPNAASFRRSRGPVVTSTRIGISRAAELPLRFYLQESQFISRRHRRD